MWDYLYCEDAANALLLLARHGRDGGIYPIGSGTARPLREYIEIIRDEIDEYSVAKRNTASPSSIAAAAINTVVDIVISLFDLRSFIISRLIIYRTPFKFFDRSEKRY